MIAAFEIQVFQGRLLKNDLNIFANSSSEKMNGAELYKDTKDGDEVLLAIYDIYEPNPEHTGNKGRFVRLEDMK